MRDARNFCFTGSLHTYSDITDADIHKTDITDFPIVTDITTITDIADSAIDAYLVT